MTRPRWVPYVVPFLVFIAFLSVGPALPVSPRVEAMVRVGVLLAVILLVARPALDVRITRPLASVAVGALIFAVWIAPDVLWPAYRESTLFQNGLTGRVESSMSAEARADRVVVALRFARAALIVPVVEELFWRGWLPRWLDRMEDFASIPLGQYTRWSFWGTAILFALEHGSFWDVGLVAGIGYNVWMQRTRSLGDLMLAHGVTNALLSGYVLHAGQWQYW
ncbi:MAG: CAAX prenyl protease-related protein [Gemmatimonadales bacterium]